MIGQTISHYRITEKLGSGGMGVVYKAEDNNLDRTVALKFLASHLLESAEHKQRFLREAKATASLDHPNICMVHEVGEAGGQVFLAMGFIDGPEVRAKIKERPLKLDEALDIAIQAGEGLRAAHHKGIVHRDIKSSNLMLSSTGQVKIMDFGLAQLTDGTRLTKTDTILGTPAYMSPEQAQRLPTDRRTDIWSLGVVLYEMVTGRLPFEGEREQAVLYSIISEPHEPVTSIRAGVPLELDRILNKALAKNPAERYQNIEDMLVDLRALRKTPLTGSGVATPVRSGRKRALIAGAGVIAASLALALGLNPGGIRDRILSGSATPSIASIAVLPLQNLSGDPEQEYFVDGMTEALIADLAKISALKVISRTSIMRYKGTGKPLRDIARELGVDAVIEGSAQRVGGNVRITAQLIDAATDQHLWAETYDRDAADVLRLQSEVARAIAQEINVTLTPQEQTLLASGRAVNPDAHDAYLQGTFLSLRPTRPNLETAQRYFELALEKDPNYAPAHAGIAWVWLARQQLGMVPPLQAGPRVVAAAEKALALDSGLAQVHYTLALMKGWVRWDFSGAEASFRRAIEIDPNYPDARVFYARLLTILKRPAEAKPQIERALELDPLNALFRAVYAQQLNFDRRYDEATTQARQALALDPDLRPAEGALTSAFLGKGMLKEAMEVSIRRRTKNGDLEIAQVLQRGYDQGRYREAARAAVELLEARSRTGTFPRGIGPYYAMADLPDKLLEFLEWAVELPDPNMPEAVRHAAQSFPQLEGNPRYQAILRRMGLP